MSAQPQYDPNFARAWRPVPDEKLTGTIIALDVRDAGYSPYPILTVERDDGGRVSVHAVHAVLSSRLADLRPTVGERIEIVYEGQVRRQDGKGVYHRYRVGMPDRPPRTSLDWSQSSDSDEREPALLEHSAPVAAAPDPDEDERIPF